MNALWEKVNREMVAKILAELEYERTLRAEPLSSDGWRIAMGNASRQFCATRGIWGWLHIDPDSLTTASGDAVEAESALLQLATVLEMSDAQTAETWRTSTPRCAATCSCCRRVTRWMRTR